MRIITFNCGGDFDLDQFGDFDLFFVQRMPRRMVLESHDPHYDKSYIQNYPTGGGVGGGNQSCRRHCG